MERIVAILFSSHHRIINAAYKLKGEMQKSFDKDLGYT